jgi:PAS domain S-box-containing protein
VGEIVVSVLAHASKALKQARESEEKFAKAFRASPDAIVISELATGRIIDINEACERLFAVTREATIGNTSLEMGLWVDPNERARLASLLARDGSVRGFQCHGRRSDGTVSFFEAAVETIELQGKPSLVGIIHDITETKRAEEGLRESEAKLRAMFEGSRDAIGVARKGVHVFANAAYLKLFGFESNERIVGTMILDSIAPSHREQVAQFVQRRSAGELIPKVYESRGIRVDGTEFDAEFSVSTYELNGEIYSMAHIRDITDRRLAARGEGETGGTAAPVAKARGRRHAGRRNRPRLQQHPLGHHGLLLALPPDRRRQHGADRLPRGDRPRRAARGGAHPPDPRLQPDGRRGAAAHPDGTGCERGGAAAARRDTELDQDRGAHRGKAPGRAGQRHAAPPGRDEPRHQRLSRRCSIRPGQLTVSLDLGRGRRVP